MEILIGENWRVKSDEHNYILQKKGIPKKSNKKGIWKTKGYFQDLQYLVDELVERELCGFEADTLQKLVSSVNRLKKTLTAKLVAS